MELHIRLSDDTESRLRDLAAAEGKDISRLIEETLVERLAHADEGLPPVDVEEWLAKLDRWLAMQRPPCGTVDDSRDSIYPDREP